MDWYSYFFGLATLPLLVLVALGIQSLADRVHSGQASRLRIRSPKTGATLSPLDFTPRLVGQIRHPVEPEERQAS